MAKYGCIFRMNADEVRKLLKLADNFYLDGVKWDSETKEVGFYIRDKVKESQ